MKQSGRAVSEASLLTEGSFAGAPSSESYDFSLRDEALLARNIAARNEETRSPLHPDSCGPCAECAEFLAERGATSSGTLYASPDSLFYENAVCKECGLSFHGGKRKFLLGGIL